MRPTENCRLMPKVAHAGLFSLTPNRLAPMAPRGRATARDPLGPCRSELYYSLLSPRSSGALMAEVAHAGHDHGEAFFIGGIYHLLVAHGAARLNDGGGAGFGSGEKAVGKREKGVGGHN